MESLVEIYLSEHGKTHVMMWASDEELFESPKVIGAILSPLRKKLPNVKIKVERVSGVLIGVQYAFIFTGKLGITPKIAILHQFFIGLAKYGFRVKHAMGQNAVPKFLLERRSHGRPEDEDEFDEEMSVLQLNTHEHEEEEVDKSKTLRRKSLRDLLGRRKGSTDSSQSDQSGH